MLPSFYIIFLNSFKIQNNSKFLTTKENTTKKLLTLANCMVNTTPAVFGAKKVPTQWHPDNHHQHHWDLSAAAHKPDQGPNTQVPKIDQAHPVPPWTHCLLHTSKREEWWRLFSVERGRCLPGHCQFHGNHRLWKGCVYCAKEISAQKH